MKLATKPIRDAKKPLILHILPEDVKAGATKDPTCCAAAKALLRQEQVLGARVHVSRTYLEFSTHFLRYETPISLRTEIISFDRGHEFEPGEYQLSAVPPSHKSEALKTTYPKRKIHIARKSKTPKARAKMHRVSGIRAKAHGI